MSIITLILSNAVTVLIAWIWASGITLNHFQAWSSSGVAPPIGGYMCESQTVKMKPKFLSYDPVMVYIEGFLSPYEAAHLASLANSSYESSTVKDLSMGNDDQFTNPSQRRSLTAWLENDDPVVSCVKERAAEFQGFAPVSTMDNMAAVKYGPGDEFSMHFDYHANVKQKVDRRTSFFAILQADCEGGGTYFPMIEPAWNLVQIGQTPPWCRFMNCAQTEGVDVKPIVGNALFWVNFHENGMGHPATAHAGQPVVDGTKIGLNIWTYSMFPSGDEMGDPTEGTY